MNKCSIVKFLIVLLVGEFFSIAAISDTLLLDSFEEGAIREVQPNQSNPSIRYLWNQYEGDPTDGPDPGSEQITTEESYHGTHSLKVTIDGGSAYMQFYPKVNSTTWKNTRELAIDTKPWQFDKYNRLRFWVKLPQGVKKLGGGRTNLHVGTYYRTKNGDKSSAESGGNHFYHYFDIESTGEWHQIIIDTHPSHIRGQSGGLEHGNQEYPTKELAYNYFDAMTRFYFDLEGSLPIYPSFIYFDGFEYYQDNNPENIDQIYGLNGVYIPTNNEIQLGWKRHKDENDVAHEIRYSFSDIFVSGWDNAIPAPDGTITPKGWQGYNGMDWSTSDINISTYSFIYIAIKPENSLLFRQIKIPISTSNTSPPNPPSSFYIKE